MGEVPGLRERKKLRTRHALISGALRLFLEKGYEQTTISEIAMAADVSTRTFFSYFASKEEVVLCDARESLDRLLRTFAERRPDEGPADLLARAVETIFETLAEDAEMGWEITEINRLVMSVPSLRAQALLLMFDVQHQMVEALQDAFPGELDGVEACAAVGSVVGTAKLAISMGLKQGGPAEEVLQGCRRAVGLALAGLRAVPPFES
ncbi:TetR/AcrR family transcriptional regulator [Streptosporangium sp. NPDC020145]|uniref:TetR/AcrR family transcriptional regulator n=1 Tax=Streptosporangium sp. NPDC020145 TaxID=3154694 RepID=UPI00341A3656